MAGISAVILLSFIGILFGVKLPLYLIHQLGYLPSFPPNFFSTYHIFAILGFSFVIPLLEPTDSYDGSTISTLTRITKYVFFSQPLAIAMMAFSLQAWWLSKN